MNADNLDIRLLRFRSRRDEYPLALATALLEAGRIPEALEVVQIGLTQSENDGALLVLEGRAWFEQGDLPQAQAALLRAAKVSPRDKEPYRWLSQVLMKRGEPARAVQVLERALQIDPTDRALQQAHMRAQRLSRIAHEADETGLPVSPSVPSAAPAAQPSERPRTSSPTLPKPGPAIPAPPKAGPAIPALATPRFVPPPPAPLARPSAPLGASARPATEARAAQPSARRSAPEPATRPFDPVPDSAPPLELSRPLPPREDNEGEDHYEGEPTLAAELPQELRSWLDAERSSHTPAPNLARSSNNDNDRDPFARSGGWRPSAEDSSFDEDSEPTLAVHSAEIRDAFDGSSRSVIVDDSSESPLELAPPADTERAPPAEPEPPEQVLQLLSTHGIFESAQRRASSEPWVPKGQAPRPGNRIGRSLAVGWLLALAAAGGGYYGFTRYLETRRGDAKSLIARATEEARDGQYESLLAAERHLTEARRLDPKAKAALESMLFVHSIRAIEDASGEMGYLRNTLARGREKGVAPALLSASEALLAAYEGDAQTARSKAEAALSLGREDARILYLVGRLYQRAGLPEAGKLLEKATALDSAFGLAWLAQGEIALEAGDNERARALFQKARGEDGKELRAELWSIVVATDAANVARLQGELAALAKRIERGSASDKLLAISARAGLALAANDVEAARAAVREGATLDGVRAPELTALFAERALAVGELQLAYRAASSTLRAAPTVPRYRDTLINVLLRRGDGHAALAALDGVSLEGGSLLVAGARAALLAGTREALDGAKRGLAAYRATPAGREDVDVGALLLRVDLGLGASGESLLPAARALAERADGRSAPFIALADVALSARQGPVALWALDKARAISPDDADVHYLAGRAQRLMGKIDAAKTSLQQALDIAPSHAEARTALAGLSLDSGDYDAAFELFSGLERDDAGLFASLGASEALLAKGDVSAAEKRLERLNAEQQAKPGARLLLARLWLAKGKPGEAAKVLELLAKEDSETRTADVLALYGDALYAAERVDSAAGAYDAALELDASHPDALVGRAMAALRAEKTSQAEELAGRARAALTTRLRPPRVRATLLLIHGKVDILAQSYSSAKEKLARAVELDGVPAEAHFWYAETLAKTKTGGASDSYAKYIELAPHGYYASRAKKALAPR